MTQVMFAVGWVDSRGKERPKQNNLSEKSK
ncbi:MAG: hypothetical protein ACJA2J_000342 [Candidatus Azotimanducaceae bacterium]|jgi:hypothetical protein